MVLLPVFEKNNCRIIPGVAFVVPLPWKTPVPSKVDPTVAKFKIPFVVKPPEKLA